ncbi:MAG: helix-turn-helix domain-containing protein [bacterium]|nr:helix-turn-helix domain-containing protein [bacterium]
MSDGSITKFEFDSDNRPMLSDEVRARLEAMTDEEIEAAARSDPDAQPLTAAELNQFERTPNLKDIRAKFGLTQKEFAETFHLSLSAVRDWEQGRFIPDRAARTLLKVIAHNPEAVKEALAHPSW